MPISMVGGLYKIISKLLANRLKTVMAPLIDESQSAFVLDRQILDGVLVANEAITWLKKKNIPGALLKLDFQKAYDSVRWSFLKQVLIKMGFGAKWTKWMMTCVGTASLSILLNGSPLKPLKMQKGLRQGDPLSPYLFILVSEALVCLLKKAEDLNLISGVSVGKNKVQLKHLQFADDTLVFVPKDKRVVTNYFRILDVFSLLSGLRLNYCKSKIISWSSNAHDWASSIARENGCGFETCPISYLGLPLGANMSNYAAWKPVISKIENKLSAWKVKLLSRAGRLTLIKSVLNSLPIYFMSMFKMPKNVAQKIVNLQRRFFWGDSKNGVMQGPSVKWSTIELPKSIGGLGVGNILHKNLILLFKWWWRFSKCEDSLWKRIIISVYNIKGLKASSHTFQGVKRGIWANLISDDANTSQIRGIVERDMQLKVGDGRTILFWHDLWCTGGPLKISYPRLFSISLQKDALICEMGVWIDEVWSWNFRWRRRLFEWERIDVENLHLSLIPPRPGIIDDVSWRGGNATSFPIKDIRDSLYASYTPVLPKEVSALIWKIKAPPRALLVIWLANLNKLKTGDFLIDKGVIEPRFGLCPFCDVFIESNSHVLFSCSFSWSLWMGIIDWCGVLGVLHNCCPLFMLSWKSLVPKRKRGKIWHLILGCVLWSLWFERNRIKFHNGERNFDKLLYTIKVRIGSWAKELLGIQLASLTGADINSAAVLFC